MKDKKNMKNKIAKWLCVVAALVAALSMIFVFAGCDRSKKRSQQDERERSQSIEQVEDALLGVLGEGWSADMSDAQLAIMAKPGDYVVASGWTSLFADVLKKSGLQTAKLKNFAAAMASEDGKALLGNLSENAELLLPVLRQVGFTKEDVSSLFYDLIYALTERSGATLDGILNELLRVRALSGLTLSAKENASICIADINSARTDLVPSESEKKAMIAAFEDARDALEALIGFAYDMFFGTISDGMWKNLFEGGALDNITNSEIELVINSLLSNVGTLKGTLTAERISKMNLAFDLLIDNFDEEKLSSALFAQIIVYAKYANMFVGVTPLLLDVVSSAGNVIMAPDMLDQLRQNAGEWSDNDGLLYVNASILAARCVKDFLDTHSGDELKAAFDGLFEMSGAGNFGSVDFDKASLLLGVDVMMNLSHFASGDGEEFSVRHPNAISEQELGDMFAAAFTLRPHLARFKEAYRAVKRGEANIMTFISALNSCGFYELGVVYQNNVQITADNIDAAYEFYMRDGVAAAERRASALTAKATTDIKLFIDDFFADGSEYASALAKLAQIPLFSGEPSEEYATQFQDDLKKSGMIGIMIALAIAFS